MKRIGNESQQAEIDAYCRRLGVVGLIQCIQKVDNGHGDYVKERQAWQKEYSVDMLLQAVEQG